MRLNAPFIRLPLSFDAAELAREIRTLSPVFWRAHPEGHAGNTALPLVALDGNPDNDGVVGPMRPTPALALCPGIRLVFAALQAPIGRSRLMRIEGNAEATLHVDTNYYWQQRVRVHIPVITTPGVRFLCGEADINMAAGESWIFDTWRLHNVINPEPTERIHLVVDTVGSHAFWRMTESATLSQQVLLDKSNAQTIVCETRNFPVVMAPTEQRRFIDWLRADMFHGAQTAYAPAGVLFGLIEQFHQRWQILWEQYGDRVSASAAADYQTALQRFGAEIDAFKGQIKLANGSDAAFIVSQWLITPAVNSALAEVYARYETHGKLLPTPTPSDLPATQSSPPMVGSRKSRFDRPIFIVAAPRSGSTLLFETLSQSATTHTVGGEAHGYFERFDALKPAKNGWHSNQAAADIASPELTALLESVLLSSARNRDNLLVPASNAPFRFLEKTPKNALRIPMLNAMFPDARFVYLYREPRDNISSIIDAWMSGGFVTYPDLPGWQPMKWSLALIPDWRQLIGKPLGEIAAQQWATINRVIMDDLATIDRNRWCALSYQDFIDNPQREVDRIVRFADVAWDKPLTGPLPLSRHTLSAPDAQKWRRNLDALRLGWPHVEAQAARARELFGSGHRVLELDEPLPENNTQLVAAAPLERPIAPAPAPVAVAKAAANSPHPFSSSPSSNLGGVLQQLRVSVAITTYQSNQLMVLRSRGSTLNTHFVELPRPMGMVTDMRRLFLGTDREVIEFRNMPEAGKRIADQPDAVFVPRVTHVSGEIDIHELGLGKAGLWAVNTRFSCLCTIDYDHSFVPRWRPPFITGYSPDDRCHLNGLAMVNGQPKFVTALGTTDHARGWRDNKAFGGILMSVDSGQILARGLSMPHSPRWYREQLWFLESGYGALCTLNVKTGEKQTIARLPGFTRGLDFVGSHAFIGLSQVRETASFSGIPITEMDVERTSGMVIVNIETGQTVASLRFNQNVQEVFAVTAMSCAWPEFVTRTDAITASAYSLPDAALRQVRAAPAAQSAKG